MRCHLAQYINFLGVRHQHELHGDRVIWVLARGAARARDGAINSSERLLEARRRRSSRCGRRRSAFPVSIAMAVRYFRSASRISAAGVGSRRA
jgi:hypothetical protein